MLGKWFGRDDPPEGVAAPAATPKDDPVALGADLTALVVRSNAAAGRLPPSVMVQIRRVEDLLREMIEHARQTGARDVHEMILIAGTVQDYLPTSVNAFLALPEAFVAAHRNAAGLTPEQDLLLQLELLESGIRDAVVSIYEGNAQRLESQGRFLHTKFSKSDLDFV